MNIFKQLKRDNGEFAPDRLDTELRENGSFVPERGSVVHNKGH